MMAKLEMDIINTHCAGIDIGSRSHFVAVGQGPDDVKEFEKAAKDCKDAEIKTFAGKTLPVLLAHLDSTKAITGKH